MDKDKDKEQQQGGDPFSLESILAEFGSSPPPPPDHSPGVTYTDEDKAEDLREKQEEAFLFPNKPKKPPEPPRKCKLPETGSSTLKAGKITAFPSKAPGPEIEKEPPPPPPEEDEAEEEAPEENKVVEFPTPPPENPVAAGIDQIRRRADNFAEHMFEEEGSEKAKSVRQAEELIPGVDEEEEAPPVRERKPRKKVPPPPDLPPAELLKRYNKGFSFFRVRTLVVFLLSLPLIYCTFQDITPLLRECLPQAEPYMLQCYLMAGVQAMAMLLGGDLLLQALIRPFRGQTGMDALCALSNLFVLIDALTLPSLQTGTFRRSPFCAVATLSLSLLMWGDLQKRRGQRVSCRTAASASEPYRVTRDEGKWNNRDTYAKWLGDASGFGSQLQEPDGAQRIYQFISPLLILACLLFSLISSVGRERGEDFLWCMAATLTAAYPLSAAVCFGLPWRRLSLRLSKLGAALAGWPGVTGVTGHSNLLLTDIDLFPVGAVALNGIKIFGDFSVERTVSLTATVIRDSGSGLTKIFHDLLRSQGTVYRKGEMFSAYEGGGVSEVFGQDLVQVGSASFMILMDVALPPGLKVKNAVFCAINGELAGIFALKYQLPGSVPPALDILIHNKITPVLCTRDFNLIPSVLRQRFKLPAEKMEFPPVERRREMSDPDQDHSPTLTAVLCREGLGPYAEAVVGSRRLRRAVRLSALLGCLGSIIGLLLAFYLTFVGAYASLTPANLLIFLIMWFIPAPIIGGNVDRY